MNIFLVIPSYNEGSRLSKTVSKASKYISPSKIIVVDDGSKKPEKLPLSSKATLLRHQINLGKGEALKTGAQLAFSKGAEAVIFMDSDGQHDPKELPQFKTYLNQGYDLVFGSRRSNLSSPLIRVLGNKIASFYINLLFGVYIVDILSGYRALTKKAYQKLIWESPRYGVEAEMVARLGKHKKSLRWIEFPIESIYIDKYKGVTIIQAIKILTQSLWWKLS